MVSIEMVTEEEATGKVKEIYEDIKQKLGIDFVPNLYRSMSAKPEYLEANWNRSQMVMKPGKLDKLTKEVIALAVSAVNGSDY